MTKFEDPNKRIETGDGAGDGRGAADDAYINLSGERSKHGVGALAEDPLLNEPSYALDTVSDEAIELVVQGETPSLEAAILAFLEVKAWRALAGGLLDAQSDEKLLRVTVDARGGQRYSRWPLKPSEDYTLGIVTVEETITGAERIANERQRQIDQEGYSPEHDAGYDGHELRFAAASYLLDGFMTIDGDGFATRCWPWDQDYFKATDPIRNLEKAGALVAAEIDRLLAPVEEASEPFDVPGTWDQGDEIEQPS